MMHGQKNIRSFNSKDTGWIFPYSTRVGLAIVSKKADTCNHHTGCKIYKMFCLQDVL